MYKHKKINVKNIILIVIVYQNLVQHWKLLFSVGEQIITN